MGSFIRNIIRIINSTDITSNYVSLQNNASCSGDRSNCNQSNEKCFEVTENTNLTTMKNSTNVTSNDEPLQTDPTYSGDGSNFNHSKDKALNKNGDEIKAENMAKVENNQGIINIGATQHALYKSGCEMKPNNARVANIVGKIYVGVTQHFAVADNLDSLKIYNKLAALEIFKHLPEFLLEDAKERLYKSESSDDQILSLHADYVPLQMSPFQQIDGTNAPGPLHTTQEIIDSFKRTGSKYLKLKNFFKKAEHFIRESDLYQKIKYEVEKENYLNLHSKIIGVIGQAGVGKSTLIKNLFQQFVKTGKLYQAKYVFKINIRDFHDKPEISLFQFLLGENAYGFNEWTKNENICTELFRLLTDCESVCILIDGLDEAEFNPEGKVNVNASNFLKQKPENFLLALLCGQLLPKAKKIITSRPGQMLDLPLRYKPKFILTISGITQESVKHICQNMCGDHAQEVYSHIQSQPDLKSYTLVPINCVLIVHCIYQFHLSDKFESLPKNVTDVFVLVFFNFLDTKQTRRNCNKYNLKYFNHLKQISQLAWSGLCKRQFHFDDNDLKDAGLDQVDLSSVTVTVKRQNHNNRVLILQNATSNCTYFSHLLIQEFFSAIYCLFFMDSKTFENTFFSSKQSDLQSNEFLMVTKFLFGLSNSKTFKDLEHIYPGICYPTEHIRLMKGLVQTIALTACTIEDETDQFRSVLNVCSWLYEFQDQEFSKQISANLPMNIKLCGVILPSDVLAFCHVIKARTNYLSLEIDSRYIIFVENASLLLLNGLQFIRTKSTVQIKKFKISRTKINDEEIELLLSFINDEIKEIEFDHCTVTPRGVENIVTRVSSLANPLQSLDLSGSNIGDSGFKSVATCLPKINQLSIGSDDDDDLTLNGVKALVESIKNSPLGMKFVFMLCPDEMESAVHQELLGLKNKVDCVMLNWLSLFDDRSRSKSNEVDLKTEKQKQDATVKTTKNYWKQGLCKAMDVKTHLKKEGKRFSNLYLPPFVENQSFRSGNISTTLVCKLISTTSAESNQLNLTADKLIDLLFDDETKRSFENQSKINLIVGNAGSGKTSLLKVLLKEYSEKESLRGYDFLFFINYEYFDHKSLISPLEFLVKNLPHSWIKDVKTSSSVIEELETKRKVCIIIDNFDCMRNPSTTSSSSSSSLHDKEKYTADVIVQLILTGKILPNAKVLITLRPYQFFQFQDFSDTSETFFNKTCKPFSIILTTGVNESGKKSIFKHLDKLYMEQVWSYIQTYPDLKSLCDVPTNCFAVVQILSTLIDEQQDIVSDLSTETAQHSELKPIFLFPLTSVVVPLILLKLWGHGLNPGECNLFELAKTVGKDLHNRSLFTHEEYKRLRREAGDVINVFIQAKYDENGFSTLISDLLVDFFVAVKIFFSFEQSEIEQKLENFNQLLNDKHQSVVRFLFGLCNESIRDILEELFPNQTYSNECSSVLKEIIRSNLNNFSVDQSDSFRFILLICSLVFEMQDEKLAGEVADWLPQQILSQTFINVNQLIGLTYVLSKRQKKEISATLAIKNEKCFELAKNLIVSKKSNIKLYRHQNI